MSFQRKIRLNLEALDGRILPGSVVTSPQVASAANSSLSSQTNTISTTTTAATQAALNLNIAQGDNRHYSHIRVAMLAYVGTPIRDLEKRLLRESVDLIIPNVAYLSQFDSLAPNTPQMIYTNVSNIYLSLVTDWLNYADRRGFDREGAFFHVNQANKFSGDSGSSKPVNWFWSIQAGSEGAGWTNYTPITLRSRTVVPFASSGRSVVIGFPDRFREINISLRSAGASSWSARLEYAAVRDANGYPTEWKSLGSASDGTSGVRRTGTITFDPPSDWRPARMNGSDYLYFVRFRTTGFGQAPVAASILGRDYVKAGGRNTGTIPAFDSKADANQDGYLSDREYRNRKGGFDARFAYEGRLFYPSYGQMRFATNPAYGGFRNWAVDYARRFLADHPRADGLFLDNSVGRLQAAPRSVKESVANYSEDYASMVGSIESGIGHKWVLANTAGGGKSVEPLARYGVSNVEEFALRPLKNSWQQFEDMANQTTARLKLMAGNGFTILDTYPVGGSPTDPRTQIASLAYYYLLADPERTFVMFNGGFEPSSTWSRHWTDASKYDVGQPKDTWSAFAKGIDPSNSRLDYKIYQRQYDRALVLYKPLSYRRGSFGTTNDSTGTTHRLPGNYRVLHADGTLGGIVNSIRLRNGEGAILIRT